MVRAMRFLRLNVGARDNVSLSPGEETKSILYKEQRQKARLYSSENRDERDRDGFWDLI